MESTTKSIAFITDHETKVDLLNNEAIAKTIISLIEQNKKNPITIGVHGDWGAGKSSILEMIESGMPSNDDVLCLKFNGWQFQGFEDAKIAVIEAIVTELIEKRSLYTKAAEEVKEILKRIDWLKVAKKAGGLAFTAFTGIPSFDTIESVINVAKSTLGGITGADAIEKAGEVSSALSGLLKEKGESQNVPKEIQEFRKAFKKLLEKSKISRLIVLIDDLDRCLPETAIETLEAIRLFIFLPSTVFIIGADEAMIEYSVRKHFPDLPESSTSQSYARNYLEKLIQVPLRIPSLGDTETKIYVTLLLLGGAIDNESQEYTQLLDLGRKALQTPWEGKGIEHDDIKKILKERFESVQGLLLLSDQISPILSAGTKGNPRQIKRFLNALSLRLSLSKERGFHDSINESTLAKLMLAELYLPSSVFEHIVNSVASSSDGTCAELNKIEQLESEAGKVVTTSKATVKEVQEVEEINPILEDWKIRSDVMRWARIEPQIGGKSLKPYLFVIKDRKNYLSTSTPLSPKLIGLLQKLLGGEATARQASGSLSSLSAGEIESLFKELRSKILGSDSFATKPTAILGLAELIKKQPALQSRYVELLEELPVLKLGPWAAAGHDALITDDKVRDRFNKLVVHWLGQAKNEAFKAALSSLAKK